MTSVLLVPDLPLERWPAMDRYANRLHDWLESTSPGFEVRLAASIGELTRERKGRRGAFVRWWTQPVDPSRIVLPHAGGGDGARPDAGDGAALGAPRLGGAAAPPRAAPVAPGAAPGRALH